MTGTGQWFGGSLTTPPALPSWTSPRCGRWGHSALEFNKHLLGTLLTFEKSNRELFDALIQDNELCDELGEYCGPQLFAALRRKDSADDI